MAKVKIEIEAHYIMHLLLAGDSLRYFLDVQEEELEYLDESLSEIRLALSKVITNADIDEAYAILAVKELLGKVPKRKL